MNVFISYDFECDRTYKEKLSIWLKELGHRNYSLSIAKRDDKMIWNEIYKRSWVCSVIVVLIGKETAKSKWIKREIDECLLVDNSFKTESSRRVRKPKGILAIHLPGGPYKVPKLIEERLFEKTAIRVSWKTINGSRPLNKKLESARKHRPS